MIKFDKSSTKSQYEKDLELAEHDGLFEEYLEMGKTSRRAKSIE